MTKKKNDHDVNEDVETKDDISSDNQPSEWEKRYKGLQKTQNLQFKQLEAAKEQIETLKATISTMETEAKESTTTLDGLNTQLEELTDEKTTLTETVDTLTNDKLRTKLILDEFPNMAEFEAKGLLPDGADVEELRTKLTSFQEQIEAMTNHQLSEDLDGSTPASTDTGQSADALSEDELWERAAQVAGKDPAEFDRIEKMRIARE